MSTISVNNLSVNGSTAANDIGAATGGTTGEKVQSLIGITAAELQQIENIVASGLNAIADGATYKKTTTAGANDANSIGAASGAAVADRLLTLIKTVDGAGSGLDADLLDGKNLATTSASGVVVGTLGTGKIDNSFLNNASTTVSGIALLGASGGAAKLTKMPDGATATYAQDDFTSHTWSTLGAAYGVLSVVSKALRVTAGSSGIFLRKTDMPASIVGKTILLKVTSSAATTINAKYWTTTWANFLSAIPVGIGTQIIPIRFPADAGVGTYFAIESGLASGQTLDIQFCWIGDYSYLTGSLSEEAARIANQLGDSAGVGVAASGTITFASIPNNGDTVTIGGKTYTFVTALTASPGVEGEVLIGGSASDTSDNLLYAISYSNGGLGTLNGTKYWAAAAHPLVRVTAAGTALPIAAKTTGELGNSITLATSSGGRITLSGSTLTGGYSDVAAKMSQAVARASQGLDAKTSIVDADEVLILDSAGGKVKKRLTWANLKTILLAADGGTTAGTAVQANDSRLVSVLTSWTPAPLFGGVADDGTWSRELANYVKAGKKISGDLIYVLTTKGTKTGDFTLGGLPFAGQAPYGVVVGVFRAMSGFSGLTAGALIMATVANNTVMSFRTQSADSTTAALTHANFNNGCRFTVHFEYLIP